MAIERYYNDNNELAVLISPCFGAGWSTWSYNYSNDLALDKRIVEYFMIHKNKSNSTLDDLENFLESIGYHNVYTGGWCDIEIVWIPKDTIFYIKEYDGAESIVTLRDMPFIKA